MGNVSDAPGSWTGLCNGLAWLRSSPAQRPGAPARDEQQPSERELDGLSLAGAKQQPCVSGANRV